MQKRLSALKTERSSFIQHWTDLSQFIMPRQARFFVTDRNRGDRRNSKINNGTATLAVRTMVSGMMGGLTSPSRPWFQLRTPDSDLNEWQPVKEWLAIVRDRMAEVFLASNLYTALPIVYADAGVFGTAALAVQEDDAEIVRFYPFPVGSYSLGTSYRGTVDTCYREFQMTVAQMVGWFGDKVSRRVQDAYNNGNHYQWIDVVHAVQPNSEHDPKRLESKFKPWASIYYEPGSDGGILRERGFDSCPVLAPRWSLIGEDIYGYSPGMDALGDVKQLQVMEKRKAEAVAKMVNPPLVAPDALQNDTISVLPGAITYVPNTAGNAAFGSAYQVNLDLNHLRADIAETEQRIKRAFYEDLFLMLGNLDGQMTAQEVLERKQEKLMLLGPTLERFNDDLLDPLIDQTFDIMMKRGMFPEPPEELQGMDLGVEYVSVMAQAAKMQGIGNLQQLTSYAGSLMAVDPTLGDRMDFEQSLVEMGNMLGTPPSVIRSDEEVEQIRAARAQQEQMAQGLAMAQAGADAAKTLSETNVTEPSALTGMIQNLQGMTPQ